MREALQRPPAPVRRNPTASASPTALSTRADSRFGRSDWPLVFAASAAAMGCVGYFVRDLDFGPADSAVLVAVHGLGTALVALIGGAQRWRMLRVYWLYVIVAGLAFVAGTAYASPFGSEPYAREELVAELGAAFLCGEAGLEPDISNSAAYIDHWRQQLSRDSRLVITAAQQAQRAADFILGRVARSAEESESHSVEGSPEEEAA